MNQGTQTADSGRKKVLFVITKSNFGGAQRYVYDLATHLPTDEFEPVVAFGSSGTDTEPGLLAQKLSAAGVRTIFVPELGRDVGFADFGAFFATRSVIQKERPYIVHLNSSKAGGLGALAARIAGVPRIVFTAHGWAFNEPRNMFVQLLIWLASVATVLLSHRVICVSDYDRRSFPAWLFGKKLVTIHNAVPDDISYLSREEARQKLAVRGHDSDTWVVSIAELTRNKNITTALDAVAEARKNGASIFYVIFGDGEERTLLEKKTYELGLVAHVYFAGYVADAAQYLRAFDVFFMPSLKEGLPYAILEAMRAGIAIVASNVGGVPEIVERDDRHLLAEPSDIAKFAHHLAHIAQLKVTDTIEVKKSVYPFESLLQATMALYH